MSEDELSLPLRSHRSTVLIAKLCRHHLRLYCLACNLNTLSQASTELPNRKTDAGPCASSLLMWHTMKKLLTLSNAAFFILRLTVCYVDLNFLENNKFRCSGTDFVLLLIHSRLTTGIG